MAIRDWKIGIRLGLAFGLMIVLMLMVFVAAWVGARTVDQHVRASDAITDVAFAAEKWTALTRQ